MKKYFLMAILATGMLSFASAQKHGVEINFLNPFGNQDFFSNNGLSFRYFLNDKVVIRGTLNLWSHSTVTKNYNGDKLDNTEKDGTLTFGLLPGLEYHFVKYEKISVFAGARIGVNLSNNSTSTKYENVSNQNDSYKRTGFGCQAGVFTGVDYNLTRNLYVGAEIDMDYAIDWSGRGKRTVGSTTTKDPVSFSTSDLGIRVIPSLRLGWRF